MEEPSVLDYIKSKLFPWKYPPIDRMTGKPGEYSRLPGSASENQRISPVGSITPETQSQSVNQAYPDKDASWRVEQSSSIAEESIQSSRAPVRWPWLSLAALALAILGQASLAPSAARGWTAGVILLAAAMACLALAIRRREWIIQPAPVEDPQVDPTNIRPRNPAGWDRLGDHSLYQLF